MARKYFTLVCLEDGQWSIAFGAYDREDVQAELDDYADRGEYRKKDMKILTTEDGQAAIDKAVEELRLKHTG